MADRFGLTLAIVLLMVACGPAAAPAAPSTATVGSGGTIVFRGNGFPTSFDPTPNAGNTGFPMGGYLFDRLVVWGPEGKLIPSLAASWTAMPDSITFKIRSDVTCSDGTKMTPTAIASSVTRTMGTVRGVGLFGSGPFKAVGDDAAGTFTFTPPTKNAYAVNGFADVYASILCPADLAPGFNWSAGAIGSGGWVIESFSPERVTMKIRPEWTWGANNTTARTPGIPERVVWRFIENETTAANLLLSGETDVSNIIGPDARRLEADRSLTRFEAPGTAALALGFNQAPNLPTADLAVRRALSTAIDRQAALNAAFDGKGVVASSLFGDTAYCFEPATKSLMPQPSTDRARQLLIEAGYTAGADGKLQKDGKPLQIVIIGMGGHGNAPEYVAAQLTKAGVTTVLRQTDTQTFATSLTAGNWDVTFIQFGSSLPLPLNAAGNTVGPWRSEGGGNAYRTRSAVADGEYRAALQSTGDESCNHFKAWQRELVGTFQIFPMAVNTNVTWTRGVKLWAPLGTAEPPGTLRLKS